MAARSVVKKGWNMRKLLLVVSVVFALSAIMVQLNIASSAEDEIDTTKRGGTAATEKLKTEKVSGDIRLLDSEKNYMIVVTKEGKLVTIDFDTKTKVTTSKELPAKVRDIGLGSSAAVEYIKKGEKNLATQIKLEKAKSSEKR
jgi:hypothetical protein